MSDDTAIREICAQLDPSNDGHWTSQGLPRMDVLAGMGLAVERRALNEALPGFNRAKAAEARGAAPGATAESAPPTPVQDDPAAHARACHRNKMAQAERRREALAYLKAGGFTLKDLQDITSPLQRRISGQNRQARKELGVS